MGLSQSCCAGIESLSGLVGPPNAAVVPPGMCVLSEQWSSVKLEQRRQVAHDVILLTFSLPDATKALGLSTCACILLKFDEEGTPEPIVRPYTPVSSNAMIGQFLLMVKVYPGGKMSQYLNDLPLGSSVEAKHIDKNVKIQYPFGKKQLTMLVGGTGIAPMIQALHAILGTTGDITKVSVIFGNKTQKDVLGKDLLDAWAKNSGGRFNLVHVLSEASDDSSWTGATGFINAELIKQHSALPSEDTLIMVCGPPPMYNALCGPRDKPDELTGLLSTMGYTAKQVYKF